jgi:hypothetical protein
MLFELHKNHIENRGVSPAISSVILTATMIAILTVAMGFANNMLWSSVAEGEFDSSRQLMQTVGFQIDDVAWTGGRTETIRYASDHGEVVFLPSALTYTVSVNGDSDQYETGALLYNIPTSTYTISNDYWERLFPKEDESLTLKGTSAPVARVFVVEKLPMVDGDYIRVVVAPSVRVLYSSINTSVSSTYYVRIYLPVLYAGESPRLSQSITLTGQSINAHTTNDVTSISVGVDFPSEDSGFDSTFFNFPDGNSENIPIPSGYDNVVLELYLSEVSVEFGLNY